LKETPSRVLNQTLKELEEDGFVSKKIYPELSPRSEYSITDIGVSFLPVIDTMFEWGKQYRDSIINTAK
jgi:DNA-binding HxlR family transcriptional regulator